ncbi:hypothetical protein PsYK624_029910 [Phanerochaete sordida]|uniref:rRNA-processing protein FYV7 n=1 Tax=Phanerochaete sordida TaxID=48140 RepID=A0A9P3LAE5_9APHY|nr:hypothetical protein PsYK624_029910 [Phanerochaete sordida]
MVGSTPAGTKRKKPPTFQHLPENRAKKLKRSWVEVQKIKSKWKAQKRKEGLTTARPVVNLELEDEHTGGGSDRGQDEESAPESGREEDEGTDSGSDGEDVGAGDEESEEESDRSEHIERVYTGEKKRGKGKGTQTATVPAGRGGEHANKRRRKDTAGDDDAAKKPTLRELQTLAYSKSSLHTYKSGSSQRQSETRGRVRGRGRGSQRGGRGRGQPDMRLRMNVMLEKIKRDYA